MNLYVSILLGLILAGIGPIFLTPKRPSLRFKAKSSRVPEDQDNCI